MKLRFYTPSKKNQARNIAHMFYIATRPGVDHGEVEIGNDIDPSTVEGHLKYMNERPGSHGLFSQNHNMPSLKSVYDKLKDHRGIVWRTVLSLKEEDAVRLGFTNKEAWEKALRATMNDAAAKMGIKESNLRWYAAFHQAQGHPHVHVVFWEDVPERTRGKLSQGERKDVRKIFIQQIYAEERLAITTEKSAIRNLIRQSAQRDVMGIIRDIEKSRVEVQALSGREPGIAPFLDPEASEKLLNWLKELSEIMPGHGRAALKYMPSETKDKAREIADWLLRQPGFFQSAIRYGDLAKKIAGHYTQRPEYLDEASQKAYEDIRDRVAQVIIKGAAAINKDKRIADLEKVRFTNHIWRQAWRTIERERSKAEAQSKYASMMAEKEAEIKTKRGQITDAAIDRI
ncbi:MAG: relaxase [Thermoanaerobacteraceae bacterium]|nr:relaxase [Thermoanaerobacteraceae bacterium]